MKSILSSQDAIRADEATLLALGKSASALAALARAGLAVPEWFLILPDAFQQCLSPWQLQALQGRRASGDAGAMGELAARAILPAALAREIEEAARALILSRRGHGEGWLVRSAEDAFDLGSPWQNSAAAVVTAPEAVAGRALALWRDAFGKNAGVAAARGPASGWQSAPVLVQRLAENSGWGVATSVDLRTGRRGIAAVEAYPAAARILEDASTPGQSSVRFRCRVDRESQVLDREPRSAADNGDDVLTDTQAVAAAKLARSAADVLGEPQCIVWSLASDGGVLLLDARPLPGLADLADPDAPSEEWLRGPAGEIGVGPAGTVSPLTFSLAREAFSASARALARALEVPAERLAACEREGVFRRLLGQARGRLCLHLPSVRRFLDLLPDDGLARRSFESAFVVPTRVAAPADTPVRKTLVALLRHHRRLRGLNARFQKQLEIALRPPEPPLDNRRPDELLAAWRELEMLGQRHWEAPALNNYLALVCDGLLRELSARWCGDATLPNSLLAGRTGERGDGMRPAEPAQRVREMAELVQNDDAIIEAFTRGEPIAGATLDAALAERPRLGVQFGEFLEMFALLAPGHLLVESGDLRSDPRPLTRAIGHYARGFRRAPYEPPTRGPDDAIRRAEGIMQTALGSQRWRALSYRWLLKQTRARLLEREAHGRTMAQVVAHARAIFLALGRRFRELGALDQPDDVVFLTVEEIAGFIEGTAPGSDLRPLVISRRRESEENAGLAAPAERFTTRGAFYRGNTFAAAPPQPEPDADDNEAATSTWRGVPGFPGAVRGRARRVTDARNAVLLQGEILVARRGEPGWAPLLVAAGGLVSEHGSTLSRVAVVARDLGIPAVFGVSGIFDSVRDGELLELNGTTGTVTRVGDV